MREISEPIPSVPDIIQHSYQNIIRIRYDDLFGKKSRLYDRPTKAEYQTS